MFRNEVVQLSTILTAVNIYDKQVATALVGEASTAGRPRRVATFMWQSNEPDMPAKNGQRQGNYDTWAELCKDYLAAHTQQFSDWHSLNAADKINEMVAAGSALEECKDRLVDAREKCTADATAVAAQAASLRRSLTAVGLSLAEGLVATGMPIAFRSVLALMKCCEPSMADTFNPSV